MIETTEITRRKWLAYATTTASSGLVWPAIAGAATAIKPDKLGWTMKVRADSGMVNLVDVTAGAMPMKYVFSLADAQTPGVLVLDSDRFVAGHAYRVELRDSSGGVQTGHVYLVAPRGINTAKVSFTSGADDHSDDGELRIRDKGSL